jgi:hypothetical protein
MSLIKMLGDNKQKNINSSSPPVHKPELSQGVSHMLQQLQSKMSLNQQQQKNPFNIP